MEKLLIYPLFCMMLLFVASYLIMISTRMKFIKEKKISMSYFKNYVRTDDMPQEFFTPTRMLSNLYEAPMLYFIVCTLAISLKFVTGLFLVFAWCFVVLRVLHAIVLLKSEDLKLRFQVFLSSMLSLLGLWVLVLFGAINS